MSATLPSDVFAYERPLKEPGEDGLPWGYFTEAGTWVRLPKTPMLLAGLGPPPFKVKLPSGEFREIVHQPSLL
jgi:hypothetical protein